MPPATSNGDAVLKHAKRAIIFVVGFTVLLFGALLLVLPGPGIVFILLALAILGSEFVWARRMLRKAKGQLNSARNQVSKWGTKARH